MRIRLTGILIFIALLSFSFQGKMPDMGQTITWSPTQLNWSDFKKRISGNTIEAACTVWGIFISTQPKQVNDTFYLDVHAFFSKTRSSKSTNKESLTENVLKHEQGHFDLGEIYARMLRKDLLEANYKNYNDFFKSVQQMYNKESMVCQKVQVQYDKETEHSIKEDVQEKWNKKIAEDLDKYKDYTDTKLKLVVKQR